MARNASLSESEIKSVTSRTSELSVLNDDECKRILSVVERDFKLRQKEFQRLEKVKKLIQLENESVARVAVSKEFNQDRCIRCFKSFRILINPKESCSECKLFICHDCATYTKETKTWGCKTCLKLKELEVITSNWFYLQSSKKHKRCGSAKIVRELHKREQELAELDELDDDLGYGTLLTSDSKDSGSVISYVIHDTNIKRELKEYSARLKILVDRLQADLAERNTYNNHRSVRGKSKETLKTYQQEITNEIGRARGALIGPFRRSNTKTSTTHELDLQHLLIQKTEEVLQTNLQHFQKTLTASKSTFNTTNFDQKLGQAIFDKCVSKEIFHELPQVIDTSGGADDKVQRRTSATSSLTSLTKPSSTQPTWSHSSPRTSSTSWEIKSHHDTIRKVSVVKNLPVDEEEDTEKEEDEDEQITNVTQKPPAINTTEEIEFDNGLRLDLSSIDDETSNRNNPRRSIDADFDAIRESNSRVGDWQTNFTLIESKPSSHSGEETPRSTRDSVFLTVPISDNKDLSPRIGDKPLDDLADDDLYADDDESSLQIPINTNTVFDPSQISDNDESTQIRKLFPLPANLLLQNHSSCSFRRPTYTYESDNESIDSSIVSVTEMKTFIDEDKFRMDPNVTDPKFILRPKDATVRYGETVKFKTKIFGTEPIDVFWFRFGTDDELVNDEKYQLSHDETYHYLKIYSTNKDDEGAYLCVIANDRAQNVDMVKLSVKDNKRSFNSPRILQEFNDNDVTEGLSLTLTCKLDQGYPKARVLWYKENSLIKPDGHYKLYYYGDGQHTLHVDETTIEDDNGTFTCLALNAAGRVQITADVFVHEKEVIDIPRKSPPVTKYLKLFRQAITSQETLPMDYDDHQADCPPTISPPMSPLQRNYQSDHEERESAKRFMDKFKNDRSSKLLENWQNLSENSVNSLQSDDDDSRSIRQQPFYLNRQPSMEKSLDEAPRSPILPKSKWEIRLPQLLNSTVGPDRQKRDLSRRHTTSIVFKPDQQSPLPVAAHNEINPLSQSVSSSPMFNAADGDRPPSPLVKHLKHKFDRMSTISLNQEDSKPHSQSHTGFSKIHRAENSSWTDEHDDNEVASLTCRGLTTNNGERSQVKMRPMLPIRTSSEGKSPPTRSISSEPIDRETSTASARQFKGKPSPPLSYSKHISSPRSTTSIVKDLIGDGATLVYDSLTQDSALHNTTSLLQYPYYPNHHQQQQRKEHVRIEQTTQSLKNHLAQHSTNNTSFALTGRQCQSDSPSHDRHRHHNTTTTITTTPMTTKIQNDSTSNNDNI